MQPAQAATTQIPITAALRNFYQNIAGKPKSSQAESDVTKFNKLAPSSGSILSAFDEQYGVNAQAQRVNDLRKSVMGAEDLVNNIDDNVFARTSGSLVSDAQRARLTAAEKDPLVKQLGIISRNFDTANTDLSGLKDESNRYSSAELGDIDTMRNSLGTRLTTAQQREAAAAAKAQQEEQNRQWWKNFALEQKKLDQQAASLKAQTANSDATIQALLAGLTTKKPSAPKKKPVSDIAKGAVISAMVANKNKPAPSGGNFLSNILKQVSILPHLGGW